MSEILPLKSPNSEHARPNPAALFMEAPRRRTRAFSVEYREDTSANVSGDLLLEPGRKLVDESVQLVCGHLGQR
jgi:hypothetical protein